MTTIREDVPLPEPVTSVDPLDPKVREMLLLPPNLAALTRICAGGTEWASSAVRIVSTEEGYLIEVTDTRRLVSVRGTMEDVDQFPKWPSLDSAMGGYVEALIPGPMFAEACKMPSALKRHSNTAINNVAVKISTDETTFGATNLESSRTMTTRHVDGRFPKNADIWPKSPPKATVKVTAALLQELLDVVAKFATDDVIILEVRGPSDLIVLRCANKTQNVTALLCPCT